MNVVDCHDKQRRLVGLGKEACTLLAPFQCGMTILLTNLKTTRSRSGGLEFHVTDANVKKVTVAKLAEVKRDTAFTPLHDLNQSSDSNAIINVKLTAWTLLTDSSPVMKLLCFDDKHSILVVLSGISRDRMITIIEKYNDKDLAGAERNDDHQTHYGASPRLLSPGSHPVKTLHLGHLVSTSAVSKLTLM